MNSKISYLVGNEQVLNKMREITALPIFFERTVEFFADLSNVLLRDNRSKKSTDLTAYAYWIRKASFEREKKLRSEILSSRLGRGVTFHIAPSNIPLAFAMSFAAAFLSGNASIVRISSRDFFEVEVICDAINDLLSQKFLDLKNYICFIRYPHDEETTKFFSEMCDVRLIWGGDNTIQTIRKIALPPRAVELTFADRHSVALIDSERYLQSNTKEIAKKFFNDTYLVDQNACSSPRMVIWLGEKISQAQERFWTELEDFVQKYYDMQPIQAVDKFSSACFLGMKNSDAKIFSKDNFIVRVNVQTLSANLLVDKPGGGYFLEYCARNIEEIFSVLNKPCQTISVFGIDKNILRKKIIAAGLRGVDRIVDFGETNKLNLVWDGFDLICEMSRIIEVDDGKFFV